MNSGSPGKWFPVDEFVLKDGWFNKPAYTEGPALQEGMPLHRLGNQEFSNISDELGRMSIPEGQLVPPGTTEPAQQTLNRILDFFKARTTLTTIERPVPEMN